MSFLLAGPSITELAREKVVIDLFRMKTFSQCWEIWQPEISRYLTEDPSPETVLSLGGKLRDVFKTTKPANRDQKAVSGGGATWEALVCYYLNLCLIGSNAVVFKKNSHIPSRILDAVRVSYGNVAANTESDLIAVTFPDDPSELEKPLAKREPVLNRLEEITHSRLKETQVTIIQCKTNWNDNAQIPMLWDMVYQAGESSNKRVNVGSHNVSPSDFKHFSYAFVTVPSNKLETFKTTSLPVKRVSELSGGNYWGLESKQGIAKGLREIFSVGRIGKDNGRSIHSALEQTLPSLKSEFKYFRL